MHWTLIIFMRFIRHVEIIKHQREVAKKDRIPSFEKYTLKPNSMQEEFIVNLRKIMEKGEERALLISATGNREIIMLTTESSTNKELSVA